MKKSLKILVAHNVSKARTGGMSRVMGFTHDQIERAGHVVDYFCADDAPQRFQGRVARFAFPLLVRSHAIAAARSGRPYDIINVHEPSAAAIARYRRAAGNPIVVATSHGIERRAWKLRLDEVRLGRESISLKTRIVYPLTSLSQSKMGFLNSDHVFCKSSEDRDYLIDWLALPQTKVTWISTGANLIFAEVAQERNYHRTENLLFAGTWIHRKGIADLTASFVHLARRYPALQLTVLGGGMPQEAIRAGFPPEIRTRVHCISTTNEEETAKAFAGADMYILPSLFETTPLTLIEAMMSGLPIITTATCGMREVIEDGRNGLLVPIRSSESIINAAERFIENENLRVRLGRAAQNEALDKYTWEQVAAPMLSVYEQLGEARQDNALPARVPANQRA